MSKVMLKRTVWFVRHFVPLRQKPYEHERQRVGSSMQVLQGD